MMGFFEVCLGLVGVVCGCLESCRGVFANSGGPAQHGVPGGLLTPVGPLAGVLLLGARAYLGQCRERVVTQENGVPGTCHWR